MICSNWYTSDELELEGNLASERNTFHRALINIGVQMHVRPDELKWTSGNSSALISVKNVYEATKKKKRNFVIGGWRKSMWSCNCPLKIKLFTWLVVENKILTWENLQHRGFNGPSYCILCKKSKETTHHLFFECSFLIAVWERVKTSIKLSRAWVGNFITKCFKNWKAQIFLYPTLSAFICWYIWMKKNSAIFEDRIPSFQKVDFQSLSAMGDYNSKLKVAAQRTVPPLPAVGRIFGVFDGVALS